jgi:hypothetical protein
MEQKVTELLKKVEVSKDVRANGRTDDDRKEFA